MTTGCCLKTVAVELHWQFLAEQSCIKAQSIQVECVAGSAGAFPQNLAYHRRKAASWNESIEFSYHSVLLDGLCLTNGLNLFQIYNSMNLDLALERLYLTR